MKREENPGEDKKELEEEEEEEEEEVEEGEDNVLIMYLS